MISRMTPSLLSTIVAIACLGYVVHGQDGSSNSTCRTITDLACDENNNLRALCEMIQISELDDDFNEETWTVFAPTDDGFERLGRRNLDSLVYGGNNTEPLTSLLLYHVVPGVAMPSSSLPCKAGENLITMASGKKTRTLCVQKTTPTYQKGEFNSADKLPQIVEPDVTACNGVIHIIDQVMLDRKLPYPFQGEEIIVVEDSSSTTAESDGDFYDVPEEPTKIAKAGDNETDIITEAAEEDDGDDDECQSISQLVCTNDEFSTLCTLLGDNALLDDLGDGLWTVFAPNNQAFDNAPRITSDIDTVLLGHTISNEMVAFEDLKCTSKVEMTNGKITRTVCDSGANKGRVYQKGNGNSDNQRPEIIDINVPACNGIVHVINEVILF